jgi:signal transduction histidine kinase
MAVNILILEDNPSDLLLLKEALAGGEVSFQITHAQTREEFKSSLEKNKFDLIISDYGIPSYDGIAALALSKKFHPDTPFILVSGIISEECAVESLKLGATDYIFKDRLGRLGPAVERALQESVDRRERDKNLAERKRLEQQLHRAQKMEAIGQLAGGIAHDFNNLLLVIHGNAELVMHQEKQLSPAANDCLRQITNAATRGANLVRQLLAFSCKQIIQFQPFNLNQSVGNLLKMVNRIIGEDITVRCQLAENLPPIQADVGMINQVLLNLIVNAKDAMPGGGSLFIETEVINLSDIRDHPEGRPGKFVRLTIRDTGSGIPPEILPRIFEPFFTTKDVGKGSGMGLAMVYGVIQQHEGWVEVKSRPGEGAAFMIYLPVNLLASGDWNASLSKPVGSINKVLLVEDDPDARKFVRTVLEDFDCEIHEAGTGREALELWNAKGKQFDLLITDIIMPGGMNGAQLAGRMRTDKSKLKVILMSGYAPDLAVNIHPQDYFLQKPYTMESLQEIVRVCFPRVSGDKS